MKLEFSRHIFEKYRNIKFHEHPSCGSSVFPCGRTDRHDEANCRFSKLCEGAQKRLFCLRNTDRKFPSWDLEPTC
jgi:hypothetical protein